jgi:DNA topoisomerase I-like protein
VLEVADRLPKIRRRLRTDLAGRGLTRERVLTAIVRLLDLGMFRIGNDQYATRDEDPSYGLSTLRPDHLRARDGCVLLEFPGKSGVEHVGTVDDIEVCSVLKTSNDAGAASYGCRLLGPFRAAMAGDPGRHHRPIPSGDQWRADDGQGLPDLARHGQGRHRTGGRRTPANAGETEEGDRVRDDRGSADRPARVRERPFVAVPPLIRSATPTSRDPMGIGLGDLECQTVAGRGKVRTQGCRRAEQQDRRRAVRGQMRDPGAAADQQPDAGVGASW